MRPGRSQSSTSTGEEVYPGRGQGKSRFHGQWVKHMWAIRGWGDCLYCLLPDTVNFPLTCAFISRILDKEIKINFIVSEVGRKVCQINSWMCIRKFIYAIRDKEIILTFTFPWKTKQIVYYCNLHPHATFTMLHLP